MEDRKGCPIRIIDPLVREKIAESNRKGARARAHEKKDREKEKKTRNPKIPLGSTDNIRRELEDGRKGRCHGSRRHVIRYFCQ